MKDLLALPEHERRALAPMDIKYPYGNTGTKKRPRSKPAPKKTENKEKDGIQLCLPLP